MSATAALPCGAKGQPAKLIQFWREHGVPHTVTWSALLKGLWACGDRGQFVWPVLLSAMHEPLPFLALQRNSLKAADRARSKIAAALVGYILKHDVADEHSHAVQTQVSTWQQTA